MITRKAQSIFEYFILTAVVVAIALVFVDTDQFKSIKESFNNAFKRSYARIVE